ncbi:MAG: ATP-binding cassette domain-containing protein [Clostridiaceae bacterium]|nr:ATP-binding cassette domain-containing protein [Clostridiaceae bacterium]
MLSIDQISKTYNAGSVNESAVFDHFSLQVPTGEFVSIVGSNGSGKTTILNLICGSIPLDQGHIGLDGRDITKMKEYQRSSFIGRVFQDPAKGTCPSMSILENLAIADNKEKSYGLKPGINKRRIDLYRTLLEPLHLGLEDKLMTPVGSLSGGQRQALALVMSTLPHIQLLILDEHTAALDPRVSETIMTLTDQLVRQKKLTTLMVTHNLKFAVQYGDRLIMMHEGRSIIDRSGPEKSAMQITDLLETFNTISIECGN